MQKYWQVKTNKSINLSSGDSSAGRGSAGKGSECVDRVASSARCSADGD